MTLVMLWGGGHDPDNLDALALLAPPVQGFSRQSLYPECQWSGGMRETLGIIPLLLLVIPLL